MHVASDEESPLIQDESSRVIICDDSTAATLQESRTRVSALPMGSMRLLFGICLVAVFNGMQSCAFEPTQLLYLKKVHLASDTDVSFLIFLTALNAASPIFGTLILSILSSQIGAAGALIVSCLTAAMGYATLIAFHSRAAFILGFLAFGFSHSNRTLRQIFVTDNIPRSCRTEAMSILAFMTPLGSLLGPTIWLMCNRFRGDFDLGLGVSLNAFTLTYTIVVIINLAMVALGSILHFATGSLEFQTESSETERPMSKGDRGFTLDMPKLMTLLFFCTLSLLSSISMAIVFETFQPILVNYMGADGDHIGAVYEGIIVFELLPPLIVAFVSRYLEDRTIMMFGFILKLFGGFLYLPVLGKIYEPQVIVGFALEGKASLFYETAMLSLVSGKFDPQFSSIGIGLVSATFNIGYTFTMYALGVTAVELFGTLKFGFFFFPVIIALCMLVANWKRLK